ncbi:maturase K [Dissostichus eleginoides]|uniref:Maturase K n=1 Tax=Dissostichus eleginoides TaxID=100907 RepID=A0AAD9BT23_DISEL|nr:maturase K [Dissostichus eleginoides]
MQREEWSYLHPEIPRPLLCGETNQCVMVKEAASPEAQFLEMFYSVFTQLYHFSRSAQHRGVQSHDLQPVNSIHAQPLVPSGSMWDGQNDTLKVLTCFMNTVHSKKFQANNRTSDFVRSGCVSRSMIVRNKNGGQERFSSYFLGGTSPCWRWFY